MDLRNLVNYGIFRLAAGFFAMLAGLATLFLGGMLYFWVNDRLWPVGGPEMPDWVMIPALLYWIVLLMFSAAVTGTVNQKQIE